MYFLGYKILIILMLSFETQLQMRNRYSTSSAFVVFDMINISAYHNSQIHLLKSQHIVSVTYSEWPD